jgi:hypothetical protein
LAVNKLPVKVRSLLGKSLGLDEASSADVVELTVESLERGRQAKSTITALVSLAKTDAMEAGVTATGLASDKGEFKAVWGLASDLDSNLGTTIPSTQVKAGLALARAAQGLDPSALGLLAKALAILNNEY